MSDEATQAPTTKHTYDTVAGTKPTPSAAHQPRTLAHTATTGADADLYMMTEIGDGVFVQWSECRACHKRVGTCTCASGPQEPPYMLPWREKRFERDLGQRPDPSFDLLPKIVTWLRERGYTVTKKGKDPAPVEPAPTAPTTPEGVPIMTEDHAESLTQVEVEDVPTFDPAATVDTGLDSALDRVREARDTSSIEDPF